MIPDIIDWLRDNYTWEQISFMSTFASAVVAFIVWISTLFQIKEMRRATNEANRPYVVVYYDVRSNNVVNLIIENIGNSLAKNIIIETEPLFAIPEKRPLFETNLLKKPIPNMPPKYKISTFLGMYFDLRGKLENNEYCSFNVKVTYSSSDNKTYVEEYYLSLESFAGLFTLREKTFHDFAKDFERFGKDFDRFSKNTLRYLDKKERLLDHYGEEILNDKNGDDDFWNMDNLE